MGFSYGMTEQSWNPEQYARNARFVSDLGMPHKVAQLKQAVKALRDAGKTGSREQMLDAKAGFYRVLLDGCENALVAEMLRTLHFRINLLRGVSMSRPGRIRHSVKEIDALCDAIYARDADAAEAAARTHVRNAEAVAIQVLESGETPGIAETASDSKGSRRA